MYQGNCSADTPNKHASMSATIILIPSANYSHSLYLFRHHSIMSPPTLFSRKLSYNIHIQINNYTCNRHVDYFLCQQVLCVLIRLFLSVLGSDCYGYRVSHSSLAVKIHMTCDIHINIYRLYFISCRDTRGSDIQYLTKENRLYSVAVE